MAILGAGRGGRGAAEGVHEVEVNGVLRLPRGPGRLVAVVEGEVLVTRAGDPEDHVLGPGAALELSGRGLALAWALRPSRLEVRRAAAPAGLPAEAALAR